MVKALDISRTLRKHVPNNLLAPPARRTRSKTFDHHNGRKGILLLVKRCGMCGARLVVSYRQTDV